MVRSSSWPRTPGFHPGDQGFESPTDYKKNIKEMANHKSSEKRIRANEKKRIHNRYYAKTMRNALRDFRALTVKDEAVAKVSALLSMIDKLAKRNIIHKNKAGNLKSKVTKKVNAL